MADAATLTLADVRLAALRVLVVGLGVGVLSLDPEHPVAALLSLLLPLWVLGPATLVERAAARRGLGAAAVGLLAGLAAGLLTPLALFQLCALDAALAAGELPAHASAGLAVSWSDLAGASAVVVPALVIAGGAALFMTLERRTTPSTSTEAVLAILALAAGFLLVLPYLVAAALDRACAARWPEPPPC